MKKDTFKRILKYIGKHTSYVFWSFIAAIFSVISSLIGPMLIGRAIDHMIEKKQGKSQWEIYQAFLFTQTCLQCLSMI